MRPTEDPVRLEHVVSIITGVQFAVSIHLHAAVLKGQGVLGQVLRNEQQNKLRRGADAVNCYDHS